MDCFCIEIIYTINDLENDIHYFVITFIFMVIVMRKMWNKNIFAQETVTAIMYNNIYIKIQHKTN
jgi:hypothetical protein